MFTSKITFVVPAYNVADYIEECLQSIVDQTNENWNLIIVNDGSTDGQTGLICEKFAKAYPQKIKYIYQKNQGLGAARNKGMQFVETPYVDFLDSDDWLPPNYVQRFYEEIERIGVQSVDMIFTLPVIYDNLEKRCYDWYDKALLLSIFKEQTIVSPRINKKLYELEVNACRKIYSTTFLGNLDFQFPEGVKWEDVYPHFYLLSKADYCLGITDIGFYYRINTSGQITKSTGRGRLDMVKVFAQTFNYLITNSAEEDIIFCAMNTLVSFSFWSIDVANMDVRKELVDKLSILYRALPDKYIELFKNRCNSKNQKLFIFCMRKPFLRKLFYDYYHMKKMSSAVERIRKLCRR